jgi:hypothetical protein
MLTRRFLRHSIFRTSFADVQNFDEVITLADEKTTKSAIDYFLTDYLIKQSTIYNLRVLIAISSHGNHAIASGPEAAPSALVLSQATNDPNDHNLLWMSALRADLEELTKHSFHVLTLVNACYGGGLFKEGPTGDDEHSMSGRGSYVVTAGPGNREVWPMPGKGKGSIFFETFLDGLRSNSIVEQQTIVSDQNVIVAKVGIVRYERLKEFMADSVDDLNKRGKIDKSYRTDYTRRAPDRSTSLTMTCQFAPTVPFSS